MRLGFDLALGLLEPPLAVGLRLFLHALPLRVGDLPRLRQDLLGLPAGLADQRPVLLEELARLRARFLRLFERPADPVPPFVDGLLDSLERDPLQHPESDGEADDRPDHQAQADLDQRIRRDEPVHQTRTYARIEPSRP